LNQQKEEKKKEKPYSLFGTSLGTDKQEGVGTPFKTDMELLARTRT